MFNNRQKELLNYILPSAGALCVTYLYNIADGIFVGLGISAMALAAVNITVPFITALVALSTLFAMGGSTVIAIRLGRKDTKGANNAFMCAFLLTLVLSVILMLTGMIFPEQISRLCGGSDNILPLAKEYLFYYTAFSVPFLLSSCFAVFVRNDGAPRLAFAGMCTGAVLNIFLDWLFIFPLKMGLKGAAIASGLGQVFAFIILLSHFIFKKGDLRIKFYVPDLSLIGKIFNRGIPEFLTQLNTPVTALCYNWVLLKTLGDVGVAAFSILSFIYAFAYAILSGTAQGLQPLWGKLFGENNKEGLKQYLNSGIKINLAASVVMVVFLIIFNRQAVEIFTKDAGLINMASGALPVFSVSFVFMALNLIYTAYFYSTKETLKSDIIAINRGVVLKALLIFAVPYIFGVRYIWHAVLLAEIITFGICLFMEKNKIVLKNLLITIL